MTDNKYYPKILIVSDATWTDDNNIGNTFTNLFSDWPKNRIAMIYARPDLPNTHACEKFFQISETRLLKRLFNRNVKTGIELKGLNTHLAQNEAGTGKRLYRFFLKYRWNIFLLAREVLWKVAKWKTKELDDFITSYQPEIVLSLVCQSVYMNDLQRYVTNKAMAKSVLYFVDDVYSLKRLYFSPLYWLKQLFVRKAIRKNVKRADLVYTIIPKQKREYDQSFKIETKILNKGGMFTDGFVPKKESNPFRLVYAGNIYAGRWKTLVKLGQALDEIDTPQNKVLYIYTRNPLTKKMEKAFNAIKSVQFMGGVPAHQVKEILNSADLLVHVESLSIREKLVTRLSFSTKLVDYFATGRTILAVGWSQNASIEYLAENQLAHVITDLKTVKNSLQEILINTAKRNEYVRNAWDFGRKYHALTTIKERLYLDFVQLL